jgi:ribulose-phosphate 3-epimerase
MCDILPGILEKDWESIEKKIRIAETFTDRIHVDIIDGKFSENKTFLDPEPFLKYSDNFFLELHMMVEEPINFLEPYAKAGFKRFLGHIEKMSSQEEFVAKGQLLGEVGLAIDGPTLVDELKINLEDLDAILIMTIKAGYSGQAFVPDNLKKINALVKRFERENVFKKPIIEVDGGINDQTIVLSEKSGAKRFIATSYIFKENPAFQLNKLKELVGSRD